ncbi:MULTISPECIES: hypothetical protein [Gracilimonas]|uniref:Peptidase M10 metallopeptidase domain-containing protein n=1 Tax=Gracilimonas sediminicola TaxID=2952158 RepID=A0A9X2L3A4_9BACT|nr:hypothetical protein [Gracilimonas sediminicola]MCP9291487.1 hypothetical protein [Gracilimonas sediminicola]
MKRSINLLAVALIMSMIFVGCENQVTETNNSLDEPAITYKGKALNNPGQTLSDEVSLADIMDSMNDYMAIKEQNYRVLMAEYITAEGSGEVGNTVIAKDVGNKQLGADFVPNDARRTWSNNGPIPLANDDITYAIDQTGDAVPFFGGLTAAAATNSIQSAMGTWDSQSCSDLSLSQNADFGLDIGYIAFLNGLGGSPFVFADVQHAGFRDINFGGGILGVAFTLVFVGPDGPTDIDNNGKSDVAFREIYYDPNYAWTNDGSGVDLETVALHEAGHGLSQAHFGKLFITKNGKFKAAPLAVMNAGYTGPQRELKGTDKGGHCSNWAEWPNN